MNCCISLLTENSAMSADGFDRTSPRDRLALPIRSSECIVVSIAPYPVKPNNIINLATIISDNCKAIHQAKSMSIDQLNTDYGIAGNLTFATGNGGFPMIHIDNGKAKAF